MKTRNKKRLITLVLAFALVFIVGAAFAFTDGILDVVGTVNISAPDDVYVVWATAVADDGATLNATHTATIANRGGPGDDLNRTAQRIVWDITFDGAAAARGDFIGAFAMLEATATNNSSQNATISNLTVRWVDAGAPIANDGIVVGGASLSGPFVPPGDPGYSVGFGGLSVNIASAGFLGLLEAGETTAANSELIVTVNWDGLTHLPEHFFREGGVAAGEPLDPGDLVLAGTLVIDFDYAPAA